MIRDTLAWQEGVFFRLARTIERRERDATPNDSAMLRAVYLCRKL